MTRLSRTIVVLASTIVLTLSGGPSALTFTGGGTGRDNAGASDANALMRASAAALAATGGGRVTATEGGDEESFFEVEVTMDDGRQVDVQLDASFAVVSSSADVEDSDGSAG